MLKELLKQRLRQEAFVAEQLAKQPFGQLWEYFHVSTMGGCEAVPEQFAAVVDDQM